MSSFSFHRWIRLSLVPAVACLCCWTSIASGQDAPVSPSDAKPDATAIAGDDTDATLRFSFSGTPWRDVIDWLAKEGNLALHIDDVPTGSFTYTDPEPFTHQQALDRVNVFLLPQGYTLVRSGKLLSVINLSDPRSMQQLRVLAQFVTLEELKDRKDHDVVRCIFPLGELKAEEAVQELAPLNLMSTPDVFSKTNQLMITDTAGKLKNVKAILDAFEPMAMDNGTVVRSFALQHVNAEDVLVVARPHLGLATGEMIGIDVSLSADVQGKNIFVTGIEDKVKLIEGLVKSIDQPKPSMSTDNGEMELRAHVVKGGNVEMVYNVLQTLLSGQSVRLSMDETADSVVALATPSVQREIEKTVAELEATEADFEVIQLKTVDPYFAISLLEEMLDLPDALDDPETIDPDAPKIDGDPANMRLYVRGKKDQIEQIKKIVTGLDENNSVGTSDELRILPMKGKQAERTLETAAKFWRGANPIILYQPTSTEPERTERVLNQVDEEPDLAVPAAAPVIQPVALDAPHQLTLTTNANSRLPSIRCQFTPRGLLLQSDDIQALNQFEEHLRTIAGPIDSLPSPPISFYLKYMKAGDAIRMLAELMDGGDSVEEAETGSLVNGYVSSGSSFLGSLVTARDGTITMITGSITVVADTRLNRLIAQGTSNDIERIEGYLKIIDKDSSITEIETYGTSHVIELEHSKASEVAAAIEAAFAGRIAGATGQTKASSGGSNAQAQREAAAAAAAAAKAAADKQQKENSKKNPPSKNSQPARSLEPKMTIAVHEASNSLIVTAPKQLFLEVEKLALSIDARNEQTVQVIAPINGLYIESVLQQVMLGESATGTQSRPSSSGSSRPTPSTQSGSRGQSGK